MKVKAFSEIVLTLLLLGMSTLAFNIQSVRASGTVYIRADGSIDSPTANITTVDNVTYTFTGNIYDEIVVERNNIVVDGAEYTVLGTGTGIGINMTGRNNVTLKNIEVRNFTYGIYLWDSSNNTIVGNIVSNNYNGIFLPHSSNNFLANNNASNNWNGIYCIFGSNDNLLTGNTVSSNTEFGIWIELDSSNNTIVGNTVSSSTTGIYLLDSSNNTIVGNIVSNNSYNGIYIYYSSNNTIVGNIVFNNDHGIYFEGSRNGHVLSPSNNILFHNNLVNNSRQVYDRSWDSLYYPPAINTTWNDGYPSGGNYWSDYNGTDLFSGPHQNVTGSDGIGDTPYVIDGNNTDRFPLMHPYGFPLGDLNMDKTVDLLDAIQVASAFGSYPEHSRWNSAADLNQDDVVDVFDVVILAGNFGENW